jgi:hypothetical protein
MNLDALKTFCFFIGYPRSGHSFIGQCLNAREDALIAHECNILFHLAIERDITAARIFELLCRRNAYFVEELGCQWEGYTYAIDTEFQLKSKRLLCIGDKKAEASTYILKNNTNLLLQLRETVGVPIRVLHYVRNPVDIIATIVFRNNVLLENALDMFLELALSSQLLLERVFDASEALTVYNEDFIANPEETLFRLSSHLGLDRDPTWERLCGEKVYRHPARSRSRVPWTVQALERLRHTVAGVPFLQRYLPEIEVFEAEVAGGRCVCLPGADLWQQSIQALSQQDAAAALHHALEAVRLGYEGHSQCLHIAKLSMASNLEAASTSVARALQLTPSCSEAFYLLAVLCVLGGDFNKASAYLVTWQEIGARPDGWGQYELGRMLAALGNPVEALHYVKMAMAEHGGIPYYQELYTKLFNKCESTCLAVLLFFVSPCVYIFA